MDRNIEFQKVKDTMRKHIDDARYGLYFTRNVGWDCTENIYIGKVFTVEICRPYGYFEVFGCTRREEEELIGYYSVLRKEYSEGWNKD